MTSRDAIVAIALGGGAFTTLILMAVWYCTPARPRQATVTDLAPMYATVGALIGACARGAPWWLLGVWAGLAWVAAPLAFIFLVSLAADIPGRAVAARIRGPRPDPPTRPMPEDGR